MPRIRTIKPEFWQDEKLSILDPLTRLVFLGLISMADDAGRLVDSVKAIDGFLFMNTNDTAHEALMKLAGMGRIARGVTASGQRVIQIVGWSRHQKIQHANLQAALPEIVGPQEDATPHEPLMNDSGGTHEPLMPHINDLRSTSGTRAHAHERRMNERRDDAWVDRFASEWEALIGMASKPKLLLHLSPLVRDHGVPQVFAAWQGYLREGQGKPWVAVTHFANTYLAIRDRWSTTTDEAGKELRIPSEPGRLEVA